MIDESILIKQAVETGDVILGLRRVEKAIKKKVVKLVVAASNCPRRPWMSRTGIKIHRYKGDNVSLGNACGKPFSISAIAIVDPGESAILTL